jgi:hypothetical protein
MAKVRDEPRAHGQWRHFRRTLGVFVTPYGCDGGSLGEEWAPAVGSAPSYIGEGCARISNLVSFLAWRSYWNSNHSSPRHQFI